MKETQTSINFRCEVSEELKNKVESLILSKDLFNNEEIHNLQNALAGLNLQVRITLDRFGCAVRVYQLKEK